MQRFMNLKEISIGNLEGVQDLMQVGCLVTNRRGAHELSLCWWEKPLVVALKHSEGIKHTVLFQEQKLTIT
jgi:hypothetical protein